MILDILYRVLFLVPDAAFCVRTVMTEADMKAAENSKEIVYPIGDFWIVWSSLNTSPFPGVDAINAVTDNQKNKAQEKARKKARNQAARNDLGIVANFKVAKQSNPALKFSDYLDGLEVDAGNIDPDS